MATDSDICRICVQEVNDYEEAKDIDLGKLRNLIKTNVLPKWKPEDFQNHLICGTCITNCRTMQTLRRYVKSSNGTLLNYRKEARKFKKKPTKFDLRLAPRFKDVPKELEICRLCSEATESQHVAIYLYDNDINLLPLTNVDKMLKAIGIFLRNLEDTLKPIMCCTCWQRVQVCYAFRARLNAVTEKVQHYRRLHETTYETRNDLNDIKIMWHLLAIPEPLEEDDDDDMPIIDVCTVESPVKPSHKPEPTVLMDHRLPSVYLKRLNVNIEQMPLLTSEIDSEDSKTTKNEIRKSLRTSTKTAKVTNTNEFTTKIIQVKTPKVTTRRTRLSIKNQIDQESDYNDLLMLTKEEIIRPFRQQKRKNAPLLKPSEPAIKEILADTKKSNLEYASFEARCQGFISDSDDEFVESTGPLNNSNDRCPIISPVPQEIIMDLDDYDSPPELELQGPCEPDYFPMAKPYSLDEKRINNQIIADLQPEEIPKKPVLTVRKDLLQPQKTVEPAKTVEPVRINLLTMEVSNKPSPTKAVKIHSNIKLRSSDIDSKKNSLPQVLTKKQNPPSLTGPQVFTKTLSPPLLTVTQVLTKTQNPPLLTGTQLFTNTQIPPALTQVLTRTQKPPLNPPLLTPLPQSKTTTTNNEEFKSGDRVLLTFDNCPMKRKDASKDGNSLLPKRQKIAATIQQLPETNGIGDKATNIPISNNQLSTANNRSLLIQKSPVKNAITQLVRKSETGNKTSNELLQPDNNSLITNRTYQLFSSGTATQATLSKLETRMSFNSQKTYRKIAPKNSAPKSIKTPSPNAKVPGIYNQQPQNIDYNNPAVMIPVGINNLPQNIKNLAQLPKSNSTKHPIVEKIVFLDNGEVRLQPVTSESQTTNQPLKKVTNPKQVIIRQVPAKPKISEAPVQNSPLSTSTPVQVQRLVSEFILISSDEEDEPQPKS
ncbi:unnamed protein product [Ceutorhynchus assimilis]|uniref:ZAD domain-containing protein n=1 Tax=Ceutorhynchus assimilis TaxID=467358 RepID=A0A9N9ME20_9CUCU|nr:unnamed protein product [Ceutorhynchus assimilis]